MSPVQSTCRLGLLVVSGAAFAFLTPVPSAHASGTPLPLPPLSPPLDAGPAPTASPSPGPLDGVLAVVDGTVGTITGGGTQPSPSTSPRPSQTAAPAPAHAVKHEEPATAAHARTHKVDPARLALPSPTPAARIVVPAPQAVPMSSAEASPQVSVEVPSDAGAMAPVRNFVPSVRTLEDVSSRDSAVLVVGLALGIGTAAAAHVFRDQARRLGPVTG